jgi:single-stranded-DNA-specific exonuclease
LPDFESLSRRASEIGNRIQVAAKSNQNILILSHYDADGLASATLVSNHIVKNKGHCDIRASVEPSVTDMESIAKSGYDLIVFLDLASSSTAKVARALGDRWISVSHEDPGPDNEIKFHNSVLNCTEYGYDGEREASASAACYYITEKSRDSKSAFLAVVGSLGEGQDTGPKRSLLGLNANILEEENQSYKELDSVVDLLLYGREVLPIHEALASNSSIFIHGLTGNKDSCLASLRSAGLDLKFNDRWKTVSDFNEDEKRSLLEAIVPHLAGTTLTAGDLVGTVYYFASEDEYSLLRDARDLALILNASGRLNRPGIGLSLCLGWNSNLRSDGEQILTDYRTELVRNVQTLVSNAERVLDRPAYSIYVGDGAVRERMTGAVCDVLASLNRARGKAVLVRTTTQQGEVEVSARLGEESPEFDLGEAMRELASSTGGSGGGLPSRAGGRFSMSKLQEFQTVVDGLFGLPRSR